MNWFEQLLGVAVPQEGQSLTVRGRNLRVIEGMLRDVTTVETGQAQTRDTFAFKWSKVDTYNSPEMDRAMREWVAQRQATLLAAIDAAAQPLALLDAGCGSGYTARLLFADRWRKLRYVGADISAAVDIARETIGKQTAACAFIQADLMHLPLPLDSFDIVMSEGVLHHTPSTREAIRSIARHVKPGGLFTCYVYAKKSPAREFTDDYVRDIVSRLPPQEAWDMLMPLTKLGKALGELNVEVDVPDDVDVLGIPKGRINIQRLFYWHFVKCYYRPEFTLDEMNHINFDWFTPVYAHRQTPQQVTDWCSEAGLIVEALRTEEAGMTVLARRPKS